MQILPYKVLNPNLIYVDLGAITRLIIGKGAFGDSPDIIIEGMRIY